MSNEALNLKHSLPDFVSRARNDKSATYTGAKSNQFIMGAVVLIPNLLISST